MHKIGKPFFIVPFDHILSFLKDGNCCQALSGILVPLFYQQAVPKNFNYAKCFKIRFHALQLNPIASKIIFSVLCIPLNAEGNVNISTKLGILLSAKHY